MERSEPFSEIVRAAIERDGVPGVGVALVRGGETVHAAGYGNADVATDAAVTEASLFGAASISKSFLATAWMQEVERGRLPLDEPVARFLPGIEVPEAGAAVTPRHLLSHGAGLPVGNVPAAQGEPSLRAQAVAAARQLGPLPAPVVYANWGYDLLAFALGEAVGRPWHEHVHETLLRPLGMERSRFAIAPDVRGHFRSELDGRLYRNDEQTSRVDPPTGGGSLVASAEELARFVGFHLTGKSASGQALLGPESLREMHREVACGTGLGFHVTRTGAGRRLVCHGGDGVGTTNLIAMLPDEGVGIVLLSNLSGGAGFRPELAGALLELLAPAQPPEPVPGGLPADAALGRYRSTFWDVELDLLREEDALTAKVVRGLGTPARPRSRLLPTGESRFRGEGGMFHGLSLALDSGGPVPQLSGGLYPFFFERTGPVPCEEEAAVDEDAVLPGAWSGSCDTPLGTIPVALRIEGPESIRVTTLGAEDALVEAPRAHRGRVEGELDTEVPGVGALRLFVRLRASGDRLEGALWSRGGMGEFEMPSKLKRD